MLVCKSRSALQAALNSWKAANKSWGFVPTMGALHQGHLSLLQQAKEEQDLTICSIFVNPTQFNDPKDLEAYPRPIEKDIAALESIGCDLLFLPPVEEVYPSNWQAPVVPLDGLDLPMEGAQRPGHFKGVVEVVYRLLELCQPKALYMGQKDFQQYAIVGKMIRELQLPVDLHCAPIVREKDGLAMSSRNVRLSPQGRALAPALYQSLQAMQSASEQENEAQNLLQQAQKSLQAAGIQEIDYFEIVDGYNLQPLKSLENTNFAVACATIRIDGVRLLDNQILKKI